MFHQKIIKEKKIIAKRDCAIQFVLTGKLEKTIAKSKQNSQHHSTHSGCSKTLIWRPSSNILALAAFLVPVYLAFASCMMREIVREPPRSVTQRASEHHGSYNSS
jgi:hypothetical protein